MSSLLIRIQLEAGGNFDGTTLLDPTDTDTEIRRVGNNDYHLFCRTCGVFDLPSIIDALPGEDVLDFKSVQASGAGRVTGYVVERALVLSPGLLTAEVAAQSPPDPFTPGDAGFPVYLAPEEVAPLAILTADVILFGGAGTSDPSPGVLTGTTVIPTGWRLALTTTGATDPSVALFNIWPIAIKRDLDAEMLFRIAP